MYSLEDLRDRYRISDAWRDEGCDGSPAKCCRSPFRDDRNASFSVFASDTQFKDHATGESGDVFRFLEIARNCEFREAVQIVGKRAGGIPVTRGNRTIRKVPARETCEKLRNMPSPVREMWEKGRKPSPENAETCEKLDIWRGWPRGTTKNLLCHNLISFPQTRNMRNPRGIAFPVCGEVAGNFSQVGMHVRIESEKPFWQFLPNKTAHGMGIPPLPFILGHGHLSTAQLVIITEGQWDCISWATWMGWLGHDTVWPNGVVLLGILGANNWKTALRFAQWPKNAAVALVPDNDLAGNSWKGNFLAELKKCSRNVSVFQPSENDLSDQLAITEDKQGLLTQLMERATA